MPHCLFVSTRCLTAALQARSLQLASHVPQAESTDGRQERSCKELVEEVMVDGSDLAALERQAAAESGRLRMYLAHQRNVKNTLRAMRLRIQRDGSELLRRQQAQHERDSQVQQEIIKLQTQLDCSQSKTAAFESKADALESKAAALADQAATKESKAMIDMQQRDERIADLEAECLKLQTMAATEKQQVLQIILLLQSACWSVPL
jgi:chromosome segregation ATPase